MKGYAFAKFEIVVLNILANETVLKDFIQSLYIMRSVTILNLGTMASVKLSRLTGVRFPNSRILQGRIYTNRLKLTKNFPKSRFYVIDTINDRIGAKVVNKVEKLRLVS
jgi:hypothetical protein